MLAKPFGQGPVARWGGGELLVGELSPDVVDHGGVVGLAVGVDSADHNGRGQVCHAGHALPLPLDRSGEARRGRVGGQDSDGRLVRRLL
jgi:hypothetical protein